MTCREEILAVIRELVQDRPDGIFSPSEVMRVMKARQYRYGVSSIATHIASVMCATSSHSRNYKYADLERVSRGRYRLRERAAQALGQTG